MGPEHYTKNLQDHSMRMYFTIDRTSSSVGIVLTLADRKPNPKTIYARITFYKDQSDKFTYGRYFRKPLDVIQWVRDINGVFGGPSMGHLDEAWLYDEMDE